ncbi:hypothetical protein [Halovulum sp. GXIMD14793]
MFLRALAVLIALIAVSVALSYAFGAEVLAALGLILTQLKVVIAKTGAVTFKSIIVWLKAQGVNFAQVELVKRWFLKSILPLIVGATMQRRISEFLQRFLDGFRRRKEAMMTAYKSWPKSVQIVSALAVLVAMLVLTMTTMSVWLIIVSVQLPIWILAASGSLWTMLWKTAQKLLFRAFAFMQLYKIWDLIKRRLPESYLRRKRRFDYKVAKAVVKQRRLTVAQLHAQKNSFSMRWSLLKEYFRHRRPEPTADEIDEMVDEDGR